MFAGLIEEEWNAAIEFLTAVGHITDAKRQEFILLWDVLGALIQNMNVNNETYKDVIKAPVFGPFFVDDATEIPIDGDIAGVSLYRQAASTTFSGSLR